MANYIYGAVALTGGATGSLDALDGTDLTTADAAIVFTPTATYIYTLVDGIGGEEDSPELIVPDTNAANKRWKLVSSRAAESALDFAAFNGIFNSTHDDVQKALSALDDMFDTGDFQIAPGSVSLADSVIKSIVTDSGTVTPSGNSVSINGAGKINTLSQEGSLVIEVDDLSIVTKTSNYTILPSDDIIIADCSGGNVQLTLPQASIKSAVSVIKKSNSNTLTVFPYGTETIEGSASVVINDEYGTLRLISDGTNTWIKSAQMFNLPLASEYTFGAVKVGANLSASGGVLTTDFSAFNQDIVPDVDITRSLGSATKAWKDVFIGPGSLYVNGQKVIEESAGTIVLSADLNQNVQIKTDGGGDIEFYPSGSGAIEMKGNLSIQGGKNLISNDGNPIRCTVGFNMDGESIIGLAAPVNPGDASTMSFSQNASNLITGTLPAQRLPGTFLEISDLAAARTTLGLNNVTNVDTTNASNITTGTLPSSVLPPIAITTTQVAATEIAMLALTTQQGDVVVRTDESKSYIRNAGTAGTMADFTELSTPVDAIQSVNNKTGSVVLTQDDVGDGATYVRSTAVFTPTLLTKVNGIESNATADQSDAEIKTAYENNANTNAFTDSLQTKLNGIETGATADMSASEILSLVKSVDGDGSGLDADTLDGYSPVTTNTGDTIVLRDASGNIVGNTIQAAYFNNTHTITSRTNDTIFYSGTDNNIKKNDVTGFKTSLGLENAPNISAASGTTANTLVQRDGNGDFSANEITASLIGNASTATQLATARTLSLAGDATGSVAFNGSANVEITVAVTNNSHSHLWANISDKPATFEPTPLSVQDIVGAMVTGNTETGIAVTYQALDHTLDFVLTADPVITLTGDVTGTGTMTNLTSVSIAATVGDDSHNHTFSTLPTVDEDDMVSNSAILLPSQQSVKAYVDTKVGDVINAAPAALDTLNELATALGNDPNFATSMTTTLGTKANNTVTITAGAGLTGGGTLAANRTISHADTSTQPSVTNAARTYIKDITLDTYGHITAIASATETVVDTDTWRGILNTPADGNSDDSISAGWAYDHETLSLAHGATDANVVSTIVARNADGDFAGRYITSTYHAMTSAATVRNADTVFYSSSDNYIRKNTLVGFKTSLGLENVTNVAATNLNTANAIVQRDSSGNFSAGIIDATCTTATFADLAEKYTCADVSLPTGTVVKACTEGKYEVEACDDTAGHTVLGVVSEAAAYIMNDKLKHSVIVGLTGKVPVRIVGPVEKGKVIISAGNGCARQITNNIELLYKIGVSLESNDSKEEKLVMCAIK